MSLSEIINGKRRSQFLLITDDYEARGDSLLIAVLQSFADQKCAIHVFCFDNPISHFKEALRTSGESNVTYHDCFTDHMGWLGQKNERNYNHELEKTMNIVVDNAIIVIDSLAAMIINSTSAVVYKLIHRVVSSSRVQGCRLVGLLHRDLVDDFEMAEMHHIASTILRICLPKPNSHGRPLCYIQQRAVKGKLLRGVEHYSVDSCNKLWSEPYNETVPSMPKEPHDPMADVTTFKLSLEEKEKEARSQLVLPYLRTDSAKELPGSGVIHYQPDEMDDWDEEDPDNDLNI